MSFHVVRNDITKVSADAIVNTANPVPVIGGGTDSAIYEAAGRENVLAERKKIGVIKAGSAAATRAYKLNAKWIIHTVGPVWQGGEKDEFDTLRACYSNSLKLAESLRCRSIAFPMISTGVYGFPKDKALQIALAAIQEFLMESDMEVILVVFDQQAFSLSGKVVDHVREYVDAHYVEEQLEAEYSYANWNCLESAPSRPSRPMPRAARASEPMYQAPSIQLEKVDLEELLANPEKTFQEKMFELMDERGLTGPQVYKNYYSKQVFSKILSNKDYHPNKFTALATCLSMKLNLEETLDLIGRAGWTLSPSNKADLVVKACILNKVYNLVYVNMILFDQNCPELEKIK